MPIGAWRDLPRGAREVGTLSGRGTLPGATSQAHDALQISSSWWLFLLLLQRLCIGASCWPASLPPLASAFGWSAVKLIGSVLGRPVSIGRPHQTHGKCSTLVRRLSAAACRRKARCPTPLRSVVTVDLTAMALEPVTHALGIDHSLRFVPLCEDD